MKTTKLFLAACFVGSLLLASCGGAKKTQASVNPDELEVNVPFSDQFTDGKYYRAVGVGVSSDMNMAKRIAMSNAKSEIAGTIQTDLNEVNTIYNSQHAEGETTDMQAKREGQTVEVVSQLLSNIIVKDQKYLKSQSTNQYRCYVVLEMAKEEVGKEVVKRLSQESKDRTDFDAYQYQKIYDQRMKEYQERNK